MDTALTRQLFAGLIQRPPLTDELLQRPPFKFIYDVVTATIQATGFLKVQYSTSRDNSCDVQELFSAEELAAKVTDKTAKAAFLQKLIDALNQVSSREKSRL